MKQDAFSGYHPAVNFLYFIGAILLSVMIQHPAYMLASGVGAAIYLILLRGKRAVKTILALFPLFVFLSAINPLFNTYGTHVLFRISGRPYTLEALIYGMVISGTFVVMLLWFHCYNLVLTGDKFICLFGNLIPALSLLLVMVMRMIPSFIRKAKQITGARKSIGKGVLEQDRNKEKIHNGMTVLSALTDWALEGSVVTADSMRARGYGTARRSSFQIYRMTGRDWGLLGLILFVLFIVIFTGGTSAVFTPIIFVAPLSWGFGAYCVFLLIPTVFHLKEDILWHHFRSRL